MTSLAQDAALTKECHARRDHFSTFHIVLQLALATLIAASHDLDRIFNLYLLLVPILTIPSLIVGFIWLGSVFANIWHLRWKRLLSAFAAPFIVFLVVSALSYWQFNPAWVRYEFNKREYQETVRAIQGPHPHYYLWRWGSTGGAAVVNIMEAVVYDESDQVKNRHGDKSEGGVTQVRSFGDHFYLVTTVFQ